MTDSNNVDVVIIGAGPSGILMSHLLGRRGISHVVLERETAGWNWLTLWDGFRMNTLNWMNRLPGSPEFAPRQDRNAMALKRDAVRWFEDYLKSVRPPLHEHTEVTHVAPSIAGWQVVTSEGNWSARAVVICTGISRDAIVPKMAETLPSSVCQLTSRQYKNPAQIETSNVLVVGSGASGSQICWDLCKDKKRFAQIYLAGSDVKILPHHVLGIPTLNIMEKIGMLTVSRDSFLGSRMYKKFLSHERGQPTPSPGPKQLAAEYGVTVVGRVESVQGAKLYTTGEAVPTDDLTIVWATGCRTDYSFIDLPDGLETNGQPRHHRGAAENAPGLFFLGLKFQHAANSHTLMGIGPDGEYLAEQIAIHVGQRN